MPLDALILDYGNVLTDPQREHWYGVMAAEAGVPTDAVHNAYSRHRHAYDSGLPAPEYWRQVLTTLSWSSTGQDQGAIVARLIEADVSSWTEYREEMWDLARSFRARGGRTAFLSNGVPEVMSRIRANRSLEQWFDVVVVSCEVGLAKPDPAIFQMCLSRLRVEPGRALFVDDRIENVEGAAGLGIRTFHFVGGDAVAQLTRSMRSLAE